MNAYSYSFCRDSFAFCPSPFTFRLGMPMCWAFGVGEGCRKPFTHLSPPFTQDRHQYTSSIWGGMMSLGGVGDELVGLAVFGVLALATQELERLTYLHLHAHAAHEHRVLGMEYIEHL